MTATITRTRRAARLDASGLDVLGNALTYAGHEYDVEPLDRQRTDFVLTVYKADDTVIVVSGSGLDQYDVERYTTTAWDALYADPFQRTNGLTRADVVALLDGGTRDLEPVES